MCASDVKQQITFINHEATVPFGKLERYYNSSDRDVLPAELGTFGIF